jgi:4-oxalmesaconate hydratase
LIIDCHGHYTTAPRQLDEYRRLQLVACDCSAKGEAAPDLLPDPSISDDDIRHSLECAQLRIQRERGTDLTIFSPKAIGMGHHIGDAQTSARWATVCNDLIHRICRLYPANFAGVCQLPQSPGVPPANCIPELERCVKELGFIGCNLNPDPTGG